jgi:hypothetical protein
MKKLLNQIATWAKKNERHISTVVFVGGFVSDLLSFTLLSVSIVSLLFVGYLVVGTLATLGTHWLLSTPLKKKESWVRKTALFMLPLATQYAIGSILSGCLIFYTKSSTFAVSWPFLLLILVVFLGNEIFRDFRANLAFQTVLLYFGLYAYAIFELPLIVNTIGPWVFLGSTAISVGLLGLFVWFIGMLGWDRLKTTLALIVPSCIGITLAISAAYFTGLVPPIPLTLPEVGVYHDITHSSAGYTLQGEQKTPWYLFWQGTTVHHVTGTPLYIYSAIFAPTQFSTSVLHKWEWYDPATKVWVTKNTVAFPINGGRGSGYRGYSEITDVVPGKWRVTIETLQGQAIGRTEFTVVSADTQPALKTEVR